MERRVIETKDGSNTIQIVNWNEQYHSIHGALQEANHVFIRHLSDYLSDKTGVTLFEMGFGTGLNACLTAELALQLKKNISYHSVEAYPIEKDEIQKLHYSKYFLDRALFQSIHDAPWERKVDINPFFQLHKQNSKLEEIIVHENSMDVIYYDAFGPRVQPHLWTPEIFTKLHAITRQNGLFITYCAKGQVRRDLSQVGFEMHKVAGPPGKREMLLGYKM